MDRDDEEYGGKACEIVGGQAAHLHRTDNNTGSRWQAAQRYAVLYRSPVSAGTGAPSGAADGKGTTGGGAAGGSAAERAIRPADERCSAVCPACGNGGICALPYDADDVSENLRQFRGFRAIRELNKMKGRGRKRPRPRHFVPQCGAFSGFCQRTAFRSFREIAVWSYQKSTVFNGFRPRRAVRCSLFPAFSQGFLFRGRFSGFQKQPRSR